MLRSSTLLLLVAAAAPVLPVVAGDAPVPAATTAATAPAPLPTKAEVDALIASSIAFLRAQQLPDGHFSDNKRFALGFTQLATLGLLKAGVPKDDPQVAKALAVIMASRQKDGGFYGESGLSNYTTSLALQILAHIKHDDKDMIRGAQDYLFGIQNREQGSLTEGGIGYGSRGKGNEDLSNTAFAIQALRDSGVPASDERLQAALKFLERCQDLSSVNKLPFVKNTGGAFYSPDESKAGGSQQTPGSPAITVMLPYGSMTYQLISSYVALDLKADDPRVQAALAWTTRNWRLDVNPGMPEARAGQGLFYYYVALARTMDLLNLKAVTLADGRTVDWRGELFQQLRQRAIQAQQGTSWVNPADRWQEGVPTLVTSYVLQSLARIRQSL